MNIDNIIEEIHAFMEDLKVYELYTSGVEPEDDSWVADWADCAFYVEKSNANA